MTEADAIAQGFQVSPPGAPRRVVALSITMDRLSAPRYARIEARVMLSPAVEVTISGELPLEVPEFGHEMARFAKTIIELAK